MMSRRSVTLVTLELLAVIALVGDSLFGGNASAGCCCGVRARVIDIAFFGLEVD